MRALSYLIFLATILTGCDSAELEILRYGTGQTGNDSLCVPLRLTGFSNYEQLVERIRAIDCNDSIPQIVIESDNIQRQVFPLVECMPPPFNPKSKHYATIRNGSAYYHSSLDPVDFDSLGVTIQKDYAYYLNGINKVYLVIIESNPEESTKGIEDFILKLTKEFDKIDTDLNLNIALWRTVNIPPPPAPPSEPDIFGKE